MHHTTSVHHTSYAHTLTSSAATTSDAPMSINDAAAKKCRFMMIVCWLMFIDVSSKIFYETANYPALERVIGEWITCLIEIGFSLWTIMGSKHECVAFHRNQSSLRFNFPNPEAWGLNAWPTLCQGVATNLALWYWNFFFLLPKWPSTSSQKSSINPRSYYEPIMS